MAALPKKKVSKARRGKRTLAHGFKPAELVACPRCGKLKTTHTVCPHCGYYKDRLVFEPKEKTKVTKAKKE
ncbi:MAG: 50S ribosomal protein L32 [Candidatus Woykebacteria bacterium GWB1_45_5]|uniref:Large ribosomal subunit protein bL32 n=2 Tax=Candidatus Woykeibacteriota TaxID=1817899 RepID=A0A1G1W3T5_9BACT|nr:MAG: 50S ribosomal protein L32 [Candidatus Woykebacteria bacterium GWA1_44_8]OGY24472.1 MAG: 50S ribosomal protein L32 [Candidatus Woykebacteria bacterium GWB1_45_5]